MEPFTTPGAFSWSELMTTDPQAAADFYGALLGWQFDTMDVGTGPYRVIKVGEAAIGGIMAMPPQAQGVPPNWCPYVTVADVDAVARRCGELGGQLLVGPMDIPTVGRFAVLRDPQGAVLNVITYAPPPAGT